MKKILQKQQIKSEKGSASSLALFTVLLFSIILMGTYMLIMTMQKSQLKSDIRIQEIYKEDVDQIDTIYQEKMEVCKIGTTSYYTLQEAISNAEENSKTSIQVTKDLTETELIMIPKEKNIELDLNGKTMTAQIKNQGNLTIKGEGTINQETSWVIENDGNCKIANCTIQTKTSATYAVHQANGTLTLESGSIKNLAETLAENTHQAQALEVDGGTATLQGGTISSICGRALGNHGTIELCGTTITSNSSNTNSYTVYATVCNFREGSLPAGVIRMTEGSITNTGDGYAVSNNAGSSNFTKTGGTITGTTNGIEQTNEINILQETIQTNEVDIPQ